MYVQSTSNDSLRNLHVEGAWLQRVTGNGVVVSFIDDGLFYFRTENVKCLFSPSLPMHAHC